jgi:hypothetical protein
MRPKVEFVKLEGRAFLMDTDFIKMTGAERGVYYTLAEPLPRCSWLCSKENWATEAPAKRER